jgi:transposase
MLTISSKVRIYLYANPTDMRKSFNGLRGLIRQSLIGDPLSGDVFLFINKRRNRIKLLIWDLDGYWIHYKQLERGTFTFSNSGDSAPEITRDELYMILAGIDIKQTKKRVRFCK